MSWRCPEVIDAGEDGIVLIRCQRSSWWHRWFGCHIHIGEHAVTIWSRRVARSQAPRDRDFEEVTP